MQILLFFISKCYSKKTDEKDQREVTLVFRFYDVIFCCFSAMVKHHGQFQKHVYYMLTVILKKYVSHMCMSYIAKNY